MQLETEECSPSPQWGGDRSWSRALAHETRHGNPLYAVSLRLLGVLSSVSAPLKSPSDLLLGGPGSGRPPPQLQHPAFEVLLVPLLGLKLQLRSEMIPVLVSVRTASQPGSGLTQAQSVSSAHSQDESPGSQEGSVGALLTGPPGSARLTPSE